MIVYQILDLARTHLNDDNAINWPDSNLLPKLQEAHRELQLELELGGIPVILDTNAILTVPVNTLDLTTVTDYPTDLIIPLQLKERFPGQQLNDFVDMARCSFIPDIQQDTRLSWWAWQREKILLLGSTSIIEVQLRYQKGLPVPTKNTDTVDFIFAELFLSHRTASLALNSTANYDRATVEKDIAMMNLTKVIQMNVNRSMQPLPAKRIPYHRRIRSSNVIRGI